MSQYFLLKELEKYIKWHIPFTAYYLYHDPYTNLWRIVEKELSPFHGVDCPYAYRFL